MFRFLNPQAPALATIHSPSATFHSSLASFHPLTSLRVETSVGARRLRDSVCTVLDASVVSYFAVRFLRLS